MSTEELDLLFGLGPLLSKAFPHLSGLFPPGMSKALGLVGHVVCADTCVMAGPRDQPPLVPRDSELVPGHQGATGLCW